MRQRSDRGSSRANGLRQSGTGGRRLGRVDHQRSNRPQGEGRTERFREDAQDEREVAGPRRRVANGPARAGFRSPGERKAAGPRTRRGSQGSEERGRDQRRRGPVVREVVAEHVRTAEDGGDSANADFVVGRRPVLEALKAGRPINKLLIAEGTEGGSLSEIVGKAKAAGIVMQTVPRSHLTKVAGAMHQGVLAYVAAQAYVELDEILTRDTGYAPLMVLLDEVNDPYNFGAILRTAEATGVQGVVIPKRRSVPLTGVVAKAAAGAVEYVPVARVSNLVQAIESLKAKGYWIVGAEGSSDKAFTDVDYTGKTALVIGAEGKGLSRLVSEKCDFLVKLPMLGKLSSLNASVAAGVMLYEIVRQRG